MYAAHAVDQRTHLPVLETAVGALESNAACSLSVPGFVVGY